MCAGICLSRAVVAVFEVAAKLRKRGINHTLQRLTWKEDSYWAVTSVKPSLVGS